MIQSDWRARMKATHEGRLLRIAVKQRQASVQDVFPSPAEVLREVRASVQVAGMTEDNTLGQACSTGCVDDVHRIGAVNIYA